MKTTLLEMMANKVTVNFHMFGALMKNIVVGNINGSAIIKLRSTQTQEPLNLEELKLVLQQTWNARYPT